MRQEPQETKSEMPSVSPLRRVNGAALAMVGVQKRFRIKLIEAKLDSETNFLVMQFIVYSKTLSRFFMALFAAEF